MNEVELIIIYVRAIAKLNAMYKIDDIIITCVIWNNPFKIIFYIVLTLFFIWGICYKSKPNNGDKEK